MFYLGKKSTDALDFFLNREDLSERKRLYNRECMCTRL
jgi:hypothetical protein